MTALFVHKELHSIISKALQESSGDINALYKKVFSAFDSGADGANLGSKPLIIISPDEVGPNQTLIPRGRMVILDQFASSDRLEVLDSASVVFSPGEYHTVNLGTIDNEHAIYDFYNTLCNVQYLKKRGPDEHNFHYMVDMVIDAINYHKNGPYNAEMMRAEAQAIHEMTDVQGFSFSKVDFDEDFRMVLTGGEGVAEEAFGRKNITVKRSDALSDMLAGVRGVWESGGITNIGPATNEFVITDQEVGRLNSLISSYIDDKINLDTLETSIVDELGGGGRHNPRQLAAFKMAQYIDIASEQLGDGARQVFADNPIIDVYHRLTGWGPIDIRNVTGDLSDRLYMDITPNIGRIGDMIFGDEVIPLDPSTMEGDIYVPRFRSEAAEHTFGETLHNIFDDRQGRERLGGIIDDMTGGPLTMSALDVETPTDVGLSEELHKSGFLRSKYDKPIISAGYHSPGGEMNAYMRRISEAEGNIWREYYKGKIVRNRGRFVFKGYGNQWYAAQDRIGRGKAWYKYVEEGKVTPLLGKDFEDALGDIVKWVGGIYGTDLYNPTSMKGKGIVSDTTLRRAVFRDKNLLEAFGAIVQEVKGYDVFETTQEGLAHFMRLSDRGRSRLLNEWLISTYPGRGPGGGAALIGEFFSMMEDAIDTAVNRMQSQGTGNVNEDVLLRSILHDVTSAYDPSAPTTSRLLADTFDIKAVSGLYGLLESRGEITPEIESMFNRFSSMDLANVQSIIRSVAAVAGHYDITETMGGVPIPRSGSIDKLLQSGFLPQEVVANLIKEGVVWTPGEGTMLEPHIGPHDIRIAEAIHTQATTLLNEVVEVNGEYVRLSDLVKQHVSGSTGILGGDDAASIYRFSWSDIVNGVDNQGEMQNVFFRRERALRVTPYNAQDFGIDYYLTKELNKGGTLFADDVMYPIGGRQTVRITGTEQMGDRFIATLQDVVTGREHRLAATSQEDFVSKLLQRFDAVVGTEREIAATTWEDVVVKALDEHRRIVDELVTGESRTVGKTVNAPEALKKIFSMGNIEPLAESAGVDFWDVYDDFKVGKATADEVTDAMRAIERSIDENEVVKRGAIVNKILSQGLFLKNKDFWADEMARNTKYIEGPVPLSPEKAALIERARTPLYARNVAYQHSGLINISKVNQKGLRFGVGNIIDILGGRGQLPGSWLPGGEKGAKLTAAEYRKLRMQELINSIIPEEAEYIQVSARTGRNAQEAMESKIRATISQIFDITDPDIMNDSRMAAAVTESAAAIIGGQGFDGPKLHTIDYDRINANELLESRLAHAERVANDKIVKYGEMFPLAQAIRDLKETGSPRGILNNIDDPVVRQFISGNKLDEYLRDMNAEAFNNFAGTIKSRGPLVHAAAPMVDTLDKRVYDIFGLVDPTIPGTEDYIPPNFISENVPPIGSYTDDIGRAIAENVTPRNALMAAAALGALAIINNAFVDRLPEKHRIKGTGYVTPSGEYIDDPSAVIPEEPVNRGAIQGRGWRMRISGIDSMAGAYGAASAIGGIGSVNVREGANREVDITNRKRIMDRTI